MNDSPPIEAAAILWHYTIKDRLGQILLDGQLRPASTGSTKKEKPVVWFSQQADWEPMVNRLWRSPEGGLLRLSKDQTIVLGGGLARISVAPAVAPHDWKTYKQRSGISPKMAKAIYDSAVAAGSKPSLWFATFEPVPRSRWLAVEIFQDEQWVLLPR
jgi:hypothetical protein